MSGESPVAILITELSTAWRRLRNGPRVLIFFALVLVPAAQLAAEGVLALPSLQQQPYVAWCVAVGILGTERERGVVHLVLALPITRARHVLGRWLGAVALAAIGLLVQLVLTLLVSAPLSSDPMLRAGEIGEWFALGLLISAAGTAAIVFLSSILPGPGDVAAATCGLLVLFGLIQAVPHLPVSAALIADLIDALKGIGWIVFPALEPGAPLRFIADAASNGALALVAAVAIMNRRELPQAGGA